MKFNLNEFLMALSTALDFVEIDILGMKSNHGKRVAYICYRIGEQFNFTREEISDLVALAILHDNGVSEYSLHKRFENENAENINYLENAVEHCIIGEKNIEEYPFFTDVHNVIKYHHDAYDGSGFFKLRGDEIPFFSQIINLADKIEINFNLKVNKFKVQQKIIEYVNLNKGIIFSPSVANTFLEIAKNKYFWLDLCDNFINMSINKIVPKIDFELPLEEIQRITKVFSKIIDSKSAYTQRHSSSLSEKIAILADYYKLGQEEKIKLIIAANLHDIGKLAIPNSILDKPGNLSKIEFEIVKEHTYYTRMALQQIKNFQDITEWASNHHEKLNGKGYPYGLSAEQLDFNSRLMACTDIYEALTEERPYRKSLNHSEAMEILYKMSEENFIDANIVKDIDKVFK